MKNKPLVSVLITVYNREKYLAEAIESVLASSYMNFELIIVDDCSIDNSYNIAKLYHKKDNRIRLYKNEKNIGQFENRNIAARYAKGKYLKYLDSDDILYFFAIELLVNAMEKYPDTSMAIASIDSNPAEVHYPIKEDPISAYKMYFFEGKLLNVGPSGILIRRDIFIEANGFKVNNATSDTELVLRIAAKYPVVRVQSGFLYYRIHENQVLTDKNKPIVYTIESFNIGMKVLKSNSCPLSKIDIHLAIRKIKYKTVKIALFFLLKKFSFGAFYLILKNTLLKNAHRKNRTKH